MSASCEGVSMENLEACTSPSAIGAHCKADLSMAKGCAIIIVSDHNFETPIIDNLRALAYVQRLYML